MPLSERDPNVPSGRTSRASVLSTGSKGAPRSHASRTDLLSSAPGVMSMLRTSTELGDIGALGCDRDSAQFRGPSRRRGVSARMSTSSLQSNSSRPRSSQHGRRPSTSSGLRRPMSRDSVPQYLPDTLSPTVMNIPLGSSPLIPRCRNSRTGRSFSMTHTTQPIFRLSSNRSFASLRNHGEHPRQRPRSPYHYPTRLRRPGYRPASPAMSDISGIHRSRMSGHPQLSRLRAPSDLSVYRDDRGSMREQHIRNRSSGRMEAFQQHPHVQQRTNWEPLSPDLTSSLTQAGDDGDSMEVHFTATRTQILGYRTIGGPTSPLYYDYSEQFARETYMEPEPDTARTGFVRQIKTIFELEDRATTEKALTKGETPLVEQNNEPTVSEATAVAELPASPVSKPITRELILTALGPNSCAGDDNMSSTTVSDKSSIECAEEQDEQVNVMSLEKELLASAERDEIESQRQSLLSQAAAHRHSIPLGTSEDGITDLLEGYQHNDTTREDAEAVVEDGTPTQPAQETSKHSPSSSVGLSCKSSAHASEGQREELCRPHCKTSDEQSFKTCEDVAIPAKGVPSPASKPPLTSVVKSESKATQLVPETFQSSPQTVPTPRPLIPPHEPNVPEGLYRERANSKLGSRSGSAAASMSSSTDSLAQKPPTVPPRESSTSKEAQRTQAVADFLVRISRHRRFTRTSSTIGKKSSKYEPAAQRQVLRKKSLKHEPAAQQEAFGGKTENDKQEEKMEKVIEEPLLSTSSSGKVAMPEQDTNAPEYNDQIAIGADASLHLKSGSRDNDSGKSSDTNPPCHESKPLNAPSPSKSESSSPCSRDGSSSGKTPLVTAEALPVAPEVNRRDSQTTTHLVWNCRQPGPRASDSMLQRRPSQRGQDESTTDLRLSAYRYPPQYLPDLKEESHEDSSLNTSASNLKNSSFRFPAGIGSSTRMSMDETTTGQRDSTAVSSYKGGSAKIEVLPTLNFSRMDLISKVNEAFDHRNSKSLDGSPGGIRELQPSGPVYPVPAAKIRDKYRSFFASLDEFERESANKDPTSIINLAPLRQSRSPEEMIAEIDKLTIPSVGGLTERLSEILPSLRYAILREDYEFPSEEEIMEHAMEELRTVQVGGPGQKRSSARLRPIPGSPHLIVVDDNVYEELTGVEDDSCRSPGGVGCRDNLVGVDGVEVGGEAHAVKGNFNRSDGHKPSVAKLDAPSPALLHAKSLSLGHQQLTGSVESKLSTRRTLHSISTSTPSDTRPWNHDKNYPWASSGPSIDIALPVRSFRGSPLAGPSSFKNGLSDTPGTNSSPGVSRFTCDSKSASPSSPDPFEPAKPSNAPFTHHRRTSHRPGLFSRYRFNSQHTGKGSDYLQAPLKAHTKVQAHVAGERYPMSSLSPPTAASLTDLAGETHSRFSTDSEDERAPNPIKRGFAKMKTHLTPGTQSQPALSAPENMQTAEGEARDFTTSRRQTFEGTAGMPKKEYHKNKIIEAVRGWFRKVPGIFKVFGRKGGKGAQDAPVAGVNEGGNDVSTRRQLPVVTLDYFDMAPETVVEHV